MDKIINMENHFIQKACETVTGNFNGNNRVVMENKKEIKLSDNELDKLIRNIQLINSHKQEIAKLEEHQNDLISLICGFNKVEFKDIEISINIEEKKLIIK